MSTSVPSPDSLLVGAKGEGTAFKNIRVVSATLTPGAVSVTASSYQATVSGISASLDVVTMIVQPTQSAIACVAVTAQAGPADNQVTIFYNAPSATAATPNPGVYKFLVHRVAPY